MVDVDRNKILRYLRELNNYTQEYVASILDINQNSYSKVESGHTRLTIERMIKLAEFYEVEPQTFLSNNIFVVTGDRITKRNDDNTDSTDSNNNINMEQKSFYEKLLDEKNEQIKILNDQLKDFRLKERRLLSILEKASIKI